MSAFFYGIILQWKVDLRNRFILLTYYIIPLVFFGFMGFIFSSINPVSKDTLIQSMTVFGVTMGAILGSPAPLVELYGSEMKKAYKVGGIPLWVIAANNFISAFIHLMIMSTVIFFAAPVVFGAKVPSNVPLYFLSLALFTVVCLALGTLPGLFLKSVSKLTLVSQAIFLPSLMLSGIMFPANLLPEALRYAGKIFPATWGFEMMSADAFDIKLLIPLVIILFACVCIIVVRISRIAAD